MNDKIQKLLESQDEKALELGRAIERLKEATDLESAGYTLTEVLVCACDMIKELRDTVDQLEEDLGDE